MSSSRHFLLAVSEYERRLASKQQQAELVAQQYSDSHRAEPPVLSRKEVLRHAGLVASRARKRVQALQRSARAHEKSMARAVSVARAGLATRLRVAKRYQVALDARLRRYERGGRDAPEVARYAQRVARRAQVRAAHRAKEAASMEANSELETKRLEDGMAREELGVLDHAQRVVPGLGDAPWLKREIGMEQQQIENLHRAPGP
eukprot:TRINITY_DN16198_c0_g1_i1.p1 TRINITY_DN16198_c0_g1~~TRINITY_DN16198_c0_g1_i1.p1  ORF type:complete len:204 (+),score=30.46 TRINITY_DN16198_c0_g1_i1:243-854(+)